MMRLIDVIIVGVVCFVVGGWFGFGIAAVLAMAKEDGK